MAIASGIHFMRKHMILILTLRYGEAKSHAHDHDHSHHIPQLFGRLRGDSGVISVKHALKRRHQGWLSDGCFSPPPFSSPQLHQSVRNVFVRLETRVGHVYNRHEEEVEQDGREHAPLTKALFYREPPRAHPVVESHACSHAIVELTDDRDNVLSHAKTGEYSPEECSINGVVRFGKIDKACVQRNPFCPRQLLLQPMNPEHYIGGRTVRPETTLFLWQDSHALPVLTEAASDDLQQFLAGVRYQRDISAVVAALCPILLFVK